MRLMMLRCQFESSGRLACAMRDQEWGERKESIDPDFELRETDGSWRLATMN